MDGWMAGQYKRIKMQKYKRTQVQKYTSTNNQNGKIFNSTTVQLLPMVGSMIELQQIKIQNTKKCKYLNMQHNKIAAPDGGMDGGMAGRHYGEK